MVPLLTAEFVGDVRGDRATAESTDPDVANAISPTAAPSRSHFAAPGVGSVQIYAAFGVADVFVMREFAAYPCVESSLMPGTPAFVGEAPVGPVHTAAPMVLSTQV
jgi:hypothetical protein